MSEDANTITLATELTIAWLANPNTRASSEDVPAFLASMHASLGSLAKGPDIEAAAPEAEEYTPAVSVRKSLAQPDRIISMIDGKPYASLKRHLREHGLTPDQYRERYGLKRDYPMVATGYSAARSAAAKRHGFGRMAEPAGSETAGSAPEQAQPDSSAEQKAKAPGRARLGIAGAKAAARQHLGDAGESPASAAPNPDAGDEPTS